jgi:hypothetical protein
VTFAYRQSRSVEALDPAIRIPDASVEESTLALDEGLDETSLRAAATETTKAVKKSGEVSSTWTSGHGREFSCARLSADLRNGSAHIRDVIEIATRMVESIDVDSLEQSKDGSKEYRIESVGAGVLRVSPKTEEGERRYEIFVASSELLHESIEEDWTNGSRLEIRLDVDESGVNRCSAFTMVEALPKEELFRRHEGLGEISVGGVLIASRESCDWSPITMRITEGGDMRQEVALPVKQLERLGEDDREAALVERLKRWD